MDEVKKLTEDEMNQATGGTAMEYLALTSLIAAIDPEVREIISDPANQDYTLYWILSHVPEINEVSFSKEEGNTAVDQHGNVLTHDELISLLRSKFGK